jgi:hypothetical protein
MHWEVHTTSKTVSIRDMDVRYPSERLRVLLSKYYSQMKNAEGSPIEVLQFERVLITLQSLHDQKLKWYEKQVSEEEDIGAMVDDQTTSETPLSSPTQLTKKLADQQTPEFWSSMASLT